jgi:hypothetical protein
MSQLAGIAAGTLVAIIVNQTSGYLEWIVLAAAAITALGVLRRKVLKPALEFIGRVDRTLDDLRGLPQVHVRLDELGAEQLKQAGRLESIENSLGSMASTERLSVKRLLQID